MIVVNKTGLILAMLKEDKTCSIQSIIFYFVCALPHRSKKWREMDARDPVMLIA